MEWTPSMSLIARYSLLHTSYHTWQFAIFTITTLISSQSFSLSPWAPAGMGKGAPALWKCCKVFCALVVTVVTDYSKTLSRPMHYFHNFSSASGGFAFAHRPTLGSTPGPRWRTFVSRPPNLPTSRKNPAGAHIFHSGLKTRRLSGSDFWQILLTNKTFSSPTGLIQRTIRSFNFFILLNGWICLHGVLDWAGSKSVFNELKILYRIVLFRIESETHTICTLLHFRNPKTDSRICRAWYEASFPRYSWCNSTDFRIMQFNATPKFKICHHFANTVYQRLWKNRCSVSVRGKPVSI